MIWVVLVYNYDLVTFYCPQGKLPKEEAAIFFYVVEI
jgi:hypothetical protein